MAVASRGRAELSPGRTKVWTEQPRLREKALVVYYLSRNGHLEHPHFMEVSLSSPQGLYFRDVVRRLSVLRGPAMAGMHSWSSKRRYRNGFVWHDLAEDDLIHPVHGNEYVLKGTELLHLHSSSSSSSSAVSRGSTTTSSSNSSEKRLVEVQTPAARSSSAASEYKVYKAHAKATEIAPISTDASTQTEEHRRPRRWAPPADKQPDPAVAELGRDEISPPPSSSSSAETLEALIKAGDGVGWVAAAAGPEDKDRAPGGCLSGRLPAPAMLMHLISCGSISVKANGFSLMPQYMGGLERAESMGRMPSFRGTVRAEDKEFFSGSLVDARKMASDGNGGELPGLSRSSSYSADRSLSTDLAKEMEEVRARCMPRRPKARRERKAE